MTSRLLPLGPLVRQGPPYRSPACHKGDAKLNSLQRRRLPKRFSIWSEYVYFIRTYRMWWLVPLILLIGVLGAFVILAGSSGTMLIYALF